MSKSKNIGTACETGLVRYLRANGFPDADRRPLKGVLDEGDVLACDGLIFEVKGGKQATVASDEQIAKWLQECEAERLNFGADLCPLVTKRAGYSERNVESVGKWWMHLPLHDLIDVAGSTPFFGVANRLAIPRNSRPGVPVRVRLEQGVALLRWAGFGEPIGAAA